MSNNRDQSEGKLLPLMYPNLNHQRKPRYDEHQLVLDFSTVSRDIVARSEKGVADVDPHKK